MSSVIRPVFTTAVALCLMTATTVAETPSPRTARDAAKQLDKANKSLAEIVKKAEDETGGKAIAVELVRSYEWQNMQDDWSRNQSGNNAYRNSQDNNQNNARNNNQNSGQNAQTNAAANNGQNSQNRDNVRYKKDRDDHNRGYGNDRDKSMNKVDFRVTCLIGHSRLRDVYVCPESAKVLSVASSSRYDISNSDYGYQGYRDARDDRNYGDDRDYRDGRQTRVNDEYIQRNSWPPNRGSTVYDDYQRGNRTARRGNNDRDDYGYDGNRNGSRNRNYNNDGYNNRRYSRNQNRYQDYQYEPGPGRMKFASEMMNKVAVDMRGRNLGDVEDVAVNPDNGEIVYIALARGGFLGLGEKLHAVPCERVIGMMPNRVRFDIRRSELNDATGFTGDQWPTKPHSQFADASNTTSANKIAKISEILGKDIVNSQDETLGEVEDVVVDIDKQHVAYLLIDCNDADGMVAVPAGAVKHQNGKCTINMPKENFKRLARFEEGDYPNWFNDRWNEGIHRDFNVQPYWENRGNNTTRVGSAATSTSINADDDGEEAVAMEETE